MDQTFRHDPCLVMTDWLLLTVFLFNTLYSLEIPLSPEITLAAFIFLCVLKSFKVLSHTHTHTHSQTCFLSYITCVSDETVLPSSSLFLSPSYILLLSLNHQRRRFPSLTQTLDPDAVFFFIFLRFCLPCSFHPTNPLALQHPYPPSPVSKYSCVSFFHR